MESRGAEILQLQAEITTLKCMRHVGQHYSYEYMVSGNKKKPKTPFA
jgi:hypothetical protein